MKRNCKNTMKRIALLTLLKEYNPIDLQEIADKKLTIDFIKKNENCFERSCLIGHITASCWLVNSDNTQALLTHHKKFNMWLQLGGHCDGDSDVLAVAIKEAQEESGIDLIRVVDGKIFDIGVHKISAYKGVPEHYHYDVRFLLQVVKDDNFIVSDESHDLKWISKDINLDEFPHYQFIARMFTKWQQSATID